jgi:hypothetical protein
MSLRDQIRADLPIFTNPEELGDVREFRINDGMGGFIVRNIEVAWDEDSAEQKPVVTIHGVYLCDVMCYIAASDLPRPPVPGELIYSPANKPWEVVKVTDLMFMYELALAAMRSQPGKYGSN